jgi:hypothetical protein
VLLWVGIVSEDVIRGKRPTKREWRRLARGARFGHRPTNEWGSGDLPAPYAEGDLLWLAQPTVERLYGMGQPGWYVVVYATSIDEGDAWYFRVTNDPEGCSDRLHVIFSTRSGLNGDADWMAPFELVETLDPDGLAERERLLAAGWTFERPARCATCGQVLR